MTSALAAIALMLAMSDCPKGRTIHVTYSGDSLPGVLVKIEDADGSVQTMRTDEQGRVQFAPLSAAGDATFTISLAGFVTQRAHVAEEFKNGPVRMELPVTPHCPYIVHGSNP